METIKLNIAIGFNRNTSQEIVESLGDLNDTSDFKYILDNANFIPHITLYQNIFPVKNIEALKQTLSDIAGNALGFKLRFERITNNKTSVWANFIKNPELMNLHQNIIDQIQPHREGLIEEQFQQEHAVYQSLTVTRKKMVDKYGHPHVGETFDPHISLMKLTDKDLVFPAMNRIDWRIREVDCNSITLFESGLESTAKTIIEEFKFN